MDLGVGSFVFAQGIVSALPILRNTAYISSNMGPKLVSVTRKSLPVIALGVARVIAVKGTDYPVCYNVIWRSNAKWTQGTRHRIWCSLELFHYARPPPCIANFASSSLGQVLRLWSCHCVGHRYGCNVSAFLT